MASKSWKGSEDATAAKLRGKRTPLSGMNGGAGTSGDVHFPGIPGRKWLYVEAKQRGARTAPPATGGSIFALFRDTATKAKRERYDTADGSRAARRPIVVYHEKGTQLRLAVLDLDLLAYLIDKADHNGSQMDI